MRIYITGASGYLGLNVLDRLIRDAVIEEIRVLASSEERKEYIRSSLIENNNSKPDLPGIGKLNFQIGRLPDVEPILTNIDCVLHLAALRGPENCNVNIKKAVEINILGTKLLVDSIRKYKCNKTIFISTQSVYVNNLSLPWTERSEPAPSDIYSATKYAGELLIQELEKDGLNYTILRLSRLYGLGLGMRENELLVRFAHNIVNKKPLEIYYNGKDTMDFINIKDITDFILLLTLNNDEQIWNEIYNVASGKSISISDLARHYISVAEKYKLGEVIINHLKTSDEVKTSHYALDINKIKTIFGWEPDTSITDGIEEMIQYELRKNI
jgi:nucleoside-diphosphate-sugar epimerase